MKNRSATSIRNGRISIFLFHSNAFYGRSSSCKFLALSFITVFLFSGQFLLFFTEFLIIKLLSTIGHWVTQLNPHKLTCSCSAENLMYNYKKRDQLTQAFSWIRPPKTQKQQNKDNTKEFKFYRWILRPHQPTTPWRNFSFFPRGFVMLFPRSVSCLYLFLQSIQYNIWQVGNGINVS